MSKQSTLFGKAEVNIIAGELLLNEGFNEIDVKISETRVAEILEQAKSFLTAAKEFLVR